MVQLGAVSVLRVRVAGRNGGSGQVLPDAAAGDGARHPVLLGSTDGNDGDAAHGESALQTGEKRLLVRMRFAVSAADVVHMLFGVSRWRSTVFRAWFRICGLGCWESSLSEA